MRTTFRIGADHWPGLSKLMEESGEVVQVCAKLIQVEGHWNHWSGDLQEMMADELGDLLAAIDFVIEKAPVGLSRPAIQKRRAEKLALFRKWHDTQDTKP